MMRAGSPARAASVSAWIAGEQLRVQGEGRLPQVLQIAVALPRPVSCLKTSFTSSPISGWR
jgi:hypothetical protein